MSLNNIKNINGDIIRQISWFTSLISGSDVSTSWKTFYLDLLTKSPVNVYMYIYIPLILRSIWQWANPSINGENVKETRWNFSWFGLFPRTILEYTMHLEFDWSRVRKHKVTLHKTCANHQIITQYFPFCFHYFFIWNMVTKLFCNDSLNCNNCNDPFFPLSMSQQTQIQT